MLMPMTVKIVNYHPEQLCFHWKKRKKVGFAGIVGTAEWWGCCILEETGLDTELVSVSGACLTLSWDPVVCRDSEWCSQRCWWQWPALALALQTLLPSYPAFRLPLLPDWIQPEQWLTRWRPKLGWALAARRSSSCSSPCSGCTRTVRSRYGLQSCWVNESGAELTVLVFQGTQVTEEAAPSISNALREHLDIFRFPHCSLSAQAMHLQ